MLQAGFVTSQPGLIQGVNPGLAQLRQVVIPLEQKHIAPVREPVVIVAAQVFCPFLAPGKELLRQTGIRDTRSACTVKHAPARALTCRFGMKFDRTHAYEKDANFIQSRFGLFWQA